MKKYLKFIIISLSLFSSSCGFITSNFSFTLPTDQSSVDPGLPAITPSPVTPPVVPPAPPPPPSLSGSAKLSGFGGLLYKASVSQGHLLVGSEQGLQILDVQNPYSPDLVSGFGQNSIYYLNSDDQKALVSTYDTNELVYLDLSDLSNPVARSRLQLTTPRKAVFNGNLAYVPDVASGIRIIDISDPDNIVLVRTVASTFASEILIDQNYLYLADGSGGLKIYDLTIPDNPSLLGQVATSGDANSLGLNGNYIYIGLQYDGIDVINVTNKSTPVFETYYYPAFYNVGPNYSEFKFYGSTMVVLDEDQGLTSFDISNPINLVYLSSAKPFADRKNGFGIGYVIIGDYAFISSSGHGIKTVAVSDKNNLRVPYTLSGQAWWATAVDASATTAYLCENNWGRIVSIDISQPSSPTLISEMSSNCSYDVIHDAGFVYTTSRDELFIYNATDPANLVLVGQYDSPSNMRKFTKSGNFIYVVSPSQLTVVNVSNPAAPVLAGSFVGDFEDVLIDGQYAYLAGSSPNLRIVNISNPASITSVSTLDFPVLNDRGYNLAKQGQNLFLSGDRIWSIVDVSNINTPIILYSDRVQTYGFSDIEVYNNKLYGCDWYNGILEYDISNLSAPRHEKTYGGGCLGFKNKSGHLLIADEDHGLKIFNDQSKQFTDSFDKYSFGFGWRDLFIIDNYTFLDNGENGFQIVDHTDTNSVSYVSNIKFDFANSKPIKNQNYIYVNNSAGIYTFDFTNPSQVSILNHTPGQSSPNREGLEISDQTLYTLENLGANRVLAMYSIANPALPVASGTLTIPDALDFLVDGQYLYVARGNTGISVYDITNKYNPVNVENLSGIGFIQNIFKFGSMIVVNKSLNAGIGLVDATNPLNLSETGTLVLTGSQVDIDKKDNYLFLAGQSNGVRIIDVTNINSPVLFGDLNQFNLGTVDSLAVKNNYLHVKSRLKNYEIFNITDVNNITQD